MDLTPHKFVGDVQPVPSGDWPHMLHMTWISVPKAHLHVVCSQRNSGKHVGTVPPADVAVQIGDSA